MRLFTVLATVVAIAAPLSTSVTGNAQTPKTDITVGRIPKKNQSKQLVSNSSSQTAKTTVPELAVTTIPEHTSIIKFAQVSTVKSASVIGKNSTKHSHSPHSLITALKTWKKSSSPQTSSQSLGDNLKFAVAEQNRNQNFLTNKPPLSTQDKATNTVSGKLVPQKKAGLVLPLKSPKKIAQTPETTAPSTPPPDTQPQTDSPSDFQPAPIQPTTQNNSETPTQENTQEQETRVLVSEVFVKSTTGEIASELEDQVYRAIQTKPGRTTTRSQLQEDINAIFVTGFFSNVRAIPEDTPLGVRINFEVQPNPVLSKVQVDANPGTNVPSVLKPEILDEIFQLQYGIILNFRELQEGVKQLTKRYQDQGYVLAQVVGSPKVSEDGVVTLQVTEGVVEDIRVRFRNKEGQDTNEKGEPIKGRTQEYVIKREVELKSGQIFNRNMVQIDLQRLFRLGLFEDVNVSLDPGDDPSKVDVILNVVERRSGSIAAGAGISSASGLFGTLSYQEQNLNGRNQKLGAELQRGQRELLFDVRFTDPWIAADPYRTSYTVNSFRRSSISLIFDGPDDRNIETFNPNNHKDDGDPPRVVRLGAGVNFTRPLSDDPYKRSEWIASAGFQYQQVSIRDADGDLIKQGKVEGSTNEFLDLSKSGDGKDDLFLVRLGAYRDRRDNALQPTKGSFFRLGLDQSIPIGRGNIFLTRLRGSYSQYIPVDFTNFSKKGAETLAFNIQGGTVQGDLPPYEAFTIGGSNSVRGYEEGALSSGRSYLQASMEYRFPVFSLISGALFADFGSDLGTTTRAAELLYKNGIGFGYGVGVRVQSPLGPIRVDFGFNDDGDNRINFGIGERF